MRTIYLDYNATTPIEPLVQEAMRPFMAEHFGNPSSSHAQGVIAAQAVEDARAQVADLFGADASEIVFTSGGTESNNLAIVGVARALAAMPDHASRRHLIISSIEHPATVEPARYLESQGYELTVVDCDRHGVVQAESIASALRPDTVLVSVIHANNEIGSIQPIAEIASACRRRGVLVHTDAAQSAGKIATDVDQLGVDLLSIAGHKVYAPKGVGALFVRSGTPIAPVIHGAGQESGVRPGTENVMFIAALGAAAAIASAPLADLHERTAALRDRLAQLLRDGVGERLTFNGEAAPQLPNTLSVNFPGVVGDELLRKVPELCASTGAACHSGTTRRSDTLAAIGLDEATAVGTLRLSLGRCTTDDEIRRAADMLLTAWASMQ